MGLNSRKSGQPVLGRALSQQPGSSLRVCRVGFLPSPELRCVRGHAEPLMFSALLPCPALPGGALPRQACPCISSLSWVCLGWAGEECPLLCCVGADGEESPSLLSLLKHREGGLPWWSGCKPKLGQRLLCLVFGCCRISAVCLWDSAELLPFRCLCLCACGQKRLKLV